MHDGCILWGGVGSGKSRAALAYYAMTDAHEDIYVITTAKKRDALDWDAEAVKFGISRVGGPHCTGAQRRLLEQHPEVRRRQERFLHLRRAASGGVG
jgi:hypothetical protein